MLELRRGEQSFPWSTFELLRIVNTGMTLGGDDPAHDLTGDEKDKVERKLREEARKLRYTNRRLARQKEARAREISRRKSRRAHR